MSRHKLDSNKFLKHINIVKLCQLWCTHGVLANPPNTQVRINKISVFQDKFIRIHNLQLPQPWKPTWKSHLSKSF